MRELFHLSPKLDTIWMPLSLNLTKKRIPKISPDMRIEDANTNMLQNCIWQDAIVKKYKMFI